MPLKEMVPWFWCVKNRVWNRRACKHSVCKDRAIMQMGNQSPRLSGVVDPE